MACATVYWGSQYDRFFNVFVDYGAVIDIRPLIGVKIGDQRKNKQMQLIEGVAD